MTPLRVNCHSKLTPLKGCIWQVELICEDVIFKLPHIYTMRGLKGDVDSGDDCQDST